ncbi:hypothetical protein GQ600_24392 [Phytophthora cactorum]|nr:hypothetical protein GQ600_24392 [Phytophthora cactorum]
MKLGKAKTSKKQLCTLNKSEKKTERKRHKIISRHFTRVGEDVVPVFMSVLRTQALEYDVRAREMEERNATQAKEIDEWEKTTATGATLGPAAAEAKLQEELRKRVQKVNEFWRSVAGFIESLDLVNLGKNRRSSTASGGSHPSSSGGRGGRRPPGEPTEQDIARSIQQSAVRVRVTLHVQDETKSLRDFLTAFEQQFEAR